MNLNFSQEEKIKFLESRGYSVIDFGVFISRNEYHNKVSFEDVNIKVAYKEGYPTILDKHSEYNERTSVERAIGLDTVFWEELKTKMLYD